jgi:glycogen debranching enzyme
LWFGRVCSELAAAIGPAIYETDCGQGRKLRDVLKNIGEGYRDGTPNGIRMDPESALVWSPSHFTWMDTNYPAATPREGYPVEIQALWVCLLSQLEGT